MIQANIPDSTVEAYTVIRAGNDFGAIIDAEYIPGLVPVDLANDSYIEVQGIESHKAGTKEGDQSGPVIFMRGCDQLEPQATIFPPVGNVS